MKPRTAAADRAFAKYRQTQRDWFNTRLVLGPDHPQTERKLAVMDLWRERFQAASQEDSRGS